METEKTFTQMIDYQKMFFDNTFNFFNMFQNQGEKIVNMSIEQNPWIPDEGKKIYAYWNKAYQKQLNNYRDFVDTGFSKAKEMMSGQEKGAQM